ncbi:hypothetical protein FACS1894172_21430 [Spirochaetia bacterium]|nr:hypothetical protein FACS1894172_21430 [Spirochaetia bacterium]
MNNWDYSIFWQESIHQVRQAVDESTFDRWLRLTELVYCLGA